MAGNDDIPDYMRGVDQQGFGSDQDNFTLRPDVEGPIGNKAYRKGGLDDDDDDDDEERPPIAGGLTGILTIVVGALVVVLALTLLFGAVVAAGATMIRDAQHEAERTGVALVEVVIEERNIVTELGARGGNRAELERMLGKVDSSSGLERAMAALAYTHAVQNEIVALGDLRNTPVQKRQHALDRAQDAFEQGLAGWESASGNTLGQIAVKAGLAEGVP